MMKVLGLVVFFIGSCASSQDFSYYFVFRLYDEKGNLIKPKEKEIEDSHLLILYQRGAKILVNNDYDYYYDSINYIRIVKFKLVSGMSSIEIVFPNPEKYFMDIQIDIDSLKNNLHNFYVNKIFYKMGSCNIIFPNSNEDSENLPSFIFENKDDTIKCYDISEYQTWNK